MLECQRDLFANYPNSIHYLNCAYMSPLLKRVEEAGINGIRAKSDPTRIFVDDFFEGVDRLKKEFSTLISNSSPSNCAVIPSISYAVANAVKNIPVNRGDEILVVEEQFPSNMYPWMQLAKESGASINIVSPPDTFINRGETWNENILDSISESTKIVALSNVHWADGTLFNLASIKEKCDKTGAYLIIDGTQSVGALPIDIDAIQPDLLAVAGYKWMLGPYSIGLAYYSDRLAKGVPIEENWINRKDSHEFARLVDYQEEYQPGAARFSVGEHSNFILVPMLTEAIKQLNQWGVDQIQDYCKRLVEPTLNILKDEGYHIEDQKYRSSHLFGIRPSGEMNVEELKNELAENKIFVSVRGSSIRVSVNVFNNQEDISILKDVLMHVQV